MSEADCVFCKIVTGEAPAAIVCRWPDALAFRPLNPVTNGHTLVVPVQHVEDWTSVPEVTAVVMARAAVMAPEISRYTNVISSAGEPATQSVFHLHVHIVPRYPGDGLHLPWTDQSAAPAPRTDQREATGPRDHAQHEEEAT